MQDGTQTPLDQRSSWHESSTETDPNENEGEPSTIVDQMKKELFSLAEVIHEESRQDSVIVIGIMDKASATVTKWANCGDVPIIDHVIQELSGRVGQGIESMSSNASMDEGSSSRGQVTQRKVDMGVQTTLSQEEINRLQVNSLILKEQFKQMKEKVDHIMKKDGLFKSNNKIAESSIQIHQQAGTPIKTSSYFRTKGEVAEP